MTEDDVKQIRRTYVGNVIKDITTRIIISVDHSSNGKYKSILDEINQKKGVYVFLFGVWVWSWINSINTNYSCLYIIMNYLNKTYGDDLLLYDNKIILKYYESRLEKHKQYLFTPGSIEFFNMFFAAQNTWNKGKISELIVVYTLRKHQTIPKKYTITSERGNLDDMIHGIDFMAITEDRTYTIQNKKVSNKIILKDGFYYIDCEYNKNTYKNLDWITVDSGSYVYLFQNSKNEKICGMPKSGEYKNKFKISEKLLTKKMEKESNNVTEILYELNKFCFDKRIPFYYNIEENGENSIEEILDNGENVIKFTLSDIDDENLFNMLSSFFTKLKESH